tara:strand:- start:81280 stop:81633 length:354 start_codon:yes stop_codon:yes gene_type:complete
MFKWKQGRQNNIIYHKIVLYSFRIWKYGLDCYLLRYQPSTILPTHTDKVNSGEHHRLNINLKGNSEFMINGEITDTTNKICLFRPDIEPHSLLIHSKTYKISFGYVKFNKSKPLKQL